MIAAGLRGISLCTTGYLLTIPDGGGYALWAVVVTSAASLVAQILRGRSEDRRAALQHKYEVEDRKAAGLARSQLRSGIAENTRITREIGKKADAAYEAGNHINEKIASIAAAALSVDRATEASSTAAIRGDIAEVRVHQ